MKIGVFDSGLGGIFILKKIRELLPEYDYLYFGDTLNVPYGDKSEQDILRFTEQAVEYLFQNCCGLVVVACNTATAVAMDTLKKKYNNDGGKKVIGVVGSTARAVQDANIVTILATAATTKSKIFENKIKTYNPNIKVISIATPTFVPLIESGETEKLQNEIARYLEITKEYKVDKLILGCTHYPIVEEMFQKYLPAHTKLVSQGDIFPDRLRDFIRENNLDTKLSRGSGVEIYVSKMTQEVKNKVVSWFGQDKFVVDLL